MFTYLVQICARWPDILLNYVQYYRSGRFCQVIKHKIDEIYVKRYSLTPNHTISLCEVLNQAETNSMKISVPYVSSC